MNIGISKSILTAILLFLATCALTPALAADADLDAEIEERLEEFRSNFDEDELIEAPTRYLKPLGYTADDVTVVTAREIRAMNAHNVGEILNRVPGLFGNMFNHQFGNVSFFSVHGAEPRSVLLLIDNIEVNYLSEGAGETHWIPVQIIDRIEIIRGQASSAWGSALAGVINIVTKRPRDPDGPRGFISGSAGKNQTGDYRLELSGRGRLNYYLFAGFKGTKGLMEGRSFDDVNLYNKYIWKPNDVSKITLVFGYSQPSIDFGSIEFQDFTYDSQERVLLSSLSFETSLTSKLTLSLSARHLQQKVELDFDSLGLGLNGPPGSRYKDIKVNEESSGISGKVVFKHSIQTIVMGVDADWGGLNHTIKLGQTIQEQGSPPSIKADPDIDKLAFFINNTIVFGKKFSLTPGLRYDRNSIDGSHLSYNLGITFSPDKNTIFRASAGKGFGLPPLLWSAGAGLFLSPNPDLDSEEIWSYQAGVESNSLKVLRIKGAVFYHDVENVIKKEIYGAGPPTFNDIYINSDDVTRKGLEFEAETVPVHGFSCYAGLAYVRFNPDDEYGASKNYSFDLAIRYENIEYFIKAELFGHYINRDLGGDINEKTDMIWDLNISKEFWSNGNHSVEVFLTGHNLLSGEQQWLDAYKTTRFWGEIGLRMTF